MHMHENEKRQVMIRMGGIEARAYDIARQDVVRYVIAAGMKPEWYRQLADDIEEGGRCRHYYDAENA